MAKSILKKDRSVASGRAMDAIEDGTGAKPTPFMRAKAFNADAIWISRRRKDDEEPAVKTKTGSHLPKFIAPQLCRLVEQPPSGADWVHEVKFDGYRMQLRVEGAEARLFTRKGLDWTTKFAAIAKAAAKLPDCIMDGEIVRPGSQRRARFRGAAGGLVGRKIRTADLLCLRPDVCGRRRSARRCPSPPARRGWRNSSSRQEATLICALSSISPAPVKRFCNRPAA